MEVRKPRNARQSLLWGCSHSCRLEVRCQMDVLHASGKGPAALPSTGCNRQPAGDAQREKEGVGAAKGICVLWLRRVAEDAGSHS